MELTAEELQQKIDDAVEAATSGLVEKNKQLLAEKKKLQRNAEIDPQTVIDLEAQVEALKGELTNGQKALKEAAKANETLQGQYKSESAFTQKLLIDNGLTEALVKAGVAAPFLSATKSMFAGQAQIIADGDSRIAKIGDKSLADAIKEWAASDEGKHFISAPANGGGGSKGGTGGDAGAKTMSRAEFDTLGPAQRAERMKAGFKIV